jgi:hypothetical protein
VCVAHLRLGGLRGKKSTPSVGWEVPVTSLRLASKRSKGAPSWRNIFDFVTFGYGIPILRFEILLSFNSENVVLDLLYSDEFLI